MFKLKNINLSDLHPNSGQVAGLPKNPRFIRDEKFKELKKSIDAAPEMLALRELLVYDHNGEYVIIAGNMRYRAMLELGMAAAPCKILPPDTPVEKLREYTIKDNLAFGQNDWDILANEWDAMELRDWGMDVWTPPAEDGYTAPATPDDIERESLPKELQDIDITPDDLPNMTGDDETLMERVIIVFPKEKKAKMAEILGIGAVEKVIYHIEELEKK